MRKMRVVIGVLLYCMWICSIAISSDFVSRQYKRNDKYSGKILNINQASTFTAASLIVCSSMCHHHGTCFGYHKPTNLCRVYPSCQEQDITGDEPGWTYYEEDIDCDSGWLEYNGHCYYLQEGLLNESQVASVCYNYGGKLAKLDDAEEKDWISKTLLKEIYFIENCIFTSLPDARLLKCMRYVSEKSGTHVSKLNWKSDNPGDGRGRRNPDAIFLEIDNECKFLGAYFCKKVTVTSADGK